VLGALIVAALYAAILRAVWHARGAPASWLLVPGVLAFITTTLIDWPWHQAGAGAIWAVAVGGTLALARHTGEDRLALQGQRT
jgi:hypothetical protein